MNFKTTSGVKLHFPRWYIPYLYPRRYKNLYGGRGSGKSHAAATNAIARVANLFCDPDNLKIGAPYYPYKTTRIMSGREFNTTIDMSVKTVLEEKIYSMGLNDQFIINSERITHRGPLGSRIIFKGLGRNINNIRSAEAIDVWWFEEAQFLTEDLMDVVIPTARQEYTCPLTGIRFKNELWMVWNPKNRSDWVWVRFVMNPRPDDLSTHVNYYANPYLPEVSAEEAEALRISDPDKYDHDWLGRPDDANADVQILPYKIIERCVDGWDRRPEISPQMSVDMGLDIAIGGSDNCAAAVRVGPILHGMKVWKGTPNTNYTAKEASDFFTQCATEVGLAGDTLYYDASTPMDGSFEATNCPYHTQAVGFGWAVTGKDIYWEPRVKNGDYFSYRNIQMATALRQRALRTGRYLDGDKDIDPWTCLFINPDIGHMERLLGMLTQPTRKRNPTNDKWMMEKDAKGKLKSPDEFDALCLAYSNDSYFGLRADG